MNRNKQFLALLLSFAMVFTNVQLPVYGAEAVATEAGVEKTNEEGTDVVIAADIVGQDATHYVYSKEELVSALNGEKSEIKIQLKDPRKGYDYTFTKDLTVKAGKDVTIDLNGQSLSVSSSYIQTKEKPFTLTVEKEGTLTMTNTSSTQSEIACKIMNYGTFITEKGNTNYDELRFENISSNALENSGEAYLNTGYIFNKTISQDTVINRGSLEIGQALLETYANSTNVIYNTGSVLMNGHLNPIEIVANGICSNGIYNDGKSASLENRAAYLIEANDGVCVVNDGGTVTMGELTADYNSYIFGKLGVLTINGGTYTQYNGAVGSHIYGIATTALAAPWLTELSGATDGNAYLYGGSVSAYLSAYSYACVYANDNYPVILNGYVEGRGAAVVQLVSAKTVSANTDVTTYHYKSFDQNDTNAPYVTYDAFEMADTPAGYQALTEIDLTQDDNVNPDESEIKSVWNYDELVKAMVSYSRIRLTSNITLSGNLVIDKNLQFVNDYDSTDMHYFSALQGDSEDDQITINEGVTVELNYPYRFKALSDNHAGITNKGTLEINREGSGNLKTDGISRYTLIKNEGNLVVNSDITGYLAAQNGASYATSYNHIIYNTGSLSVNGYILANGQYTNAVYNAGKMTLNSAGQLCAFTAKCTNGLYNEGTAMMNGGNIFYQNISSNGVYNKGSFLMYKGTIQRDGSATPDNVTAIAYEAGHEPVLIGGFVGGLNYHIDKNISANNTVLGSAVILINNGEYQTGSFKNSTNEGTPLINGMNAWSIIDGKIRSTCKIRADHDYLLLEPNETISQANTELFDTDISGLSENDLKRELVVVPANTDTISVDGMNVTAKKVGTAYLVYKIYKTTDQGATELMATSDQIRIEVCTDRSQIIGDSYKASILNENVTANGYYSASYELPVTWSLKECLAGSNQDIIDQSFEPEEVIIDNQEFTEFFNYDPVLKFNAALKEYYISYKAKKGKTYSAFLEGDVDQINDIQVTLRVENKLTGKKEDIDAGSFNIQTVNTKPSATFQAQEVNTAFTGEVQDASYEYVNRVNLQDGDYYSSNCNTDIDAIDCTSVPDGFYDRGNDEYSYEGAACKAKANFVANVTFSDYYGSYQTTIPVNLVNETPSLTPVTTKFEVTKKAGQGFDLYDYLCADRKEFLTQIEKIEVVGKKAQYKVVNADPDGFGGTNEKLEYIGSSFYLQPITSEVKSGKVNLKVTYKDTLKKVKGKVKTVNLSVNVKASSKYSMKAVTKSPVLYAKSYTDADGSTKYDKIQYQFKVAPENDKTGTFKVSNLNGESVSVSSVCESGSEENVYYFNIAANDKTKNLPAKQKKLNFEVYWYANAENAQNNTQATQHCKPLKVSVKLDRTATVVDDYSKEITMDLNKAWIKDKNGNINTSQTVLQMGAYYTLKSKGFSIEGISGKLFNKTYEKKGYKIYPTYAAVASGAVKAGESYNVVVTLIDEFGVTMQLPLTIHVKPVAKVTATATLNGTLYQDVPYVQAPITLGTVNPCMGMTIEKVEVADQNSSYECSNYLWGLGDYYDDDQIWMLHFKDYQKPSKMDSSVILKITYTNGATTTTKLRVNTVSGTQEK